MIDIASETAQLFGIPLTSGQLMQLDMYQRELLDWNDRMNLTAIRDLDGIRVRHFLDSMSCSLAWKGQRPPDSLIDVGTGAGFPGIVLKILFPDMKLTLVESVGKKMAFCTHIVTMMGWSDVRMKTDRIEKIGREPDFRETFDVAVARALAPLPVLAEYLLPLVKVGGLMVAPKGGGVDAELMSGSRVASMMGGAFREKIPILLPGDQAERCLLVFAKIKNTPDAYPRAVGVPASNPL